MSEEYIEEGINGQWTDWKFEAENYKKIYEHLYQENKRLKEKYEKLQEAFKKAITTEHHKIHALLDIIDEVRTSIDYMIGNVDISEIHGTKLKQILDKTKEN